MPTTQPDWTRLLIDVAEFDARQDLAHWSWLVDRSYDIVGVSRFGDWFLVGETGAVLRLDILEGSLDPLCATVSEFEARRSHDRELIEWFQDGMVYALYDSGVVPGRGECFTYRHPPIIGGSTDRENITTGPVGGWQLFMSQLHEQVRHLPPGTTVLRLDWTPHGLKVIYQGQ